MGHRNARDLVKRVYDDFSNLVVNNWNDIRDLAIQHSYWTNRGDGDEILAMKRATFSTLLNAEESIVQNLDNSRVWMETAKRLRTLVDFLKSLGCFILTRGTIEDYYTWDSAVSVDDKRNAAAYQALHLMDTDKRNVRIDYEDIVGAMEFAAQVKAIDEGVGIRDLVLAAVAPALANLDPGTTAVELKARSRAILGKRAELFELRVEGGKDPQLVVELKSEILDVNGFPLSVPIGANPISRVNQQMGLE